MTTEPLDPHRITGQRLGEMAGGSLLINEYADGTFTAQFRATDWEQWSHPQTVLKAIPVEQHAPTGAVIAR